MRLVDEPRFGAADLPRDDAFVPDDALPREDAFAPDDAVLFDDAFVPDDERFEEAFVPEDERFDGDFAWLEASRLSRTASSCVAPASARLPTALTALRAVLPTAFAASVTFPLVSFAELFNCDSVRFAAVRFLVAAAFLAAASR